MVTKEKLHRLVDELPDEEVRAAERFLEYLHDRVADPVLRAFVEAPVDTEEPLTPEDEAAIREGKEELDRGEGIPLDVVLCPLDCQPEP